MSQPNKPLRIGFFLVNQYGGRGGVEKVLRLLTAELRSQGIDTTLIFTDTPVDATFLEHFPNQVKVEIPPLAPSPIRLLPKGISHFIAKRRFRSMLQKAFNHAIIPLHLDALVIVNLPTNFIKYNDLIIRTKRRHNLKMISWLHGSLAHLPPADIAYIQRALPIFDAHLAIGKGIQQELAHFFNLSAPLVYNPVADAPLVRRNHKRLLYIGRIDDNKRVTHLINMVRDIPGDWTLDIIGSTGDIDKDHAFSHWLQTTPHGAKIHFHGWQENPWDLVQEAGLLLLNSKSEGFGLVLAEAMIRGIPCIAADCPVGPSEIIQSGVNGWLYPVDQEQVGATMIAEVIEGARILPDPLAVRATAEKFLIKNSASMFIHHIQTIIKEEK